MVVFAGLLNQLMTSGKDRSRSTDGGIIGKFSGVWFLSAPAGNVKTGLKEGTAGVIASRLKCITYPTSISTQSR